MNNVLQRCLGKPQKEYFLKGRAVGLKRLPLRRKKNIFREFFQFVENFPTAINVEAGGWGWG